MGEEGCDEEKQEEGMGMMEGEERVYIYIIRGESMLWRCRCVRLFRK